MGAKLFLVFFWGGSCCCSFLGGAFRVWSCVPCLRLCEVDDHVDAADVADDQGAGVDDALDDLVDDDKEADCDISIITINSNVSNTIINTSTLIISNIKISTIRNIKSTILMIVNR